MNQLSNLTYELNLKDISNLLNDILDKLDAKPSKERTNSIKYQINLKNFPSLFHPEEYKDDEYIESAVDVLLSRKIFIIEQPKKESHLEFRKKLKAKLVFNNDFEESLRNFYNRPTKKDAWKTAAEQINCDVNIKKLILNNKITISGKIEYDVMDRMLRLLVSSNYHKSVRHVSAKYFWGMSKILDSKEQIIEFCKLKHMPILLHVKSMSNNPKKILFIENQDTYLEATDSKEAIFKEYILIFSSGFKASSKRLREKEGSRIFFADECHFRKKDRINFKKWLYKEIKTNMDVYFWGDLDFTGISILSSLKKIFPNIKAWEHGYNLLLKALKNGDAHSPSEANKDGQIEPTSTQCQFADSILIPILKDKKLFVDQEYANISGKI